MALSLWLLARPRFGFFLLWIPFIGYGFALWDRALDWVRLPALGWVLVAWFLLNAGTMWLNAALGQDESGALFAPAVPLPPAIRRFAYLALAGGVALATIAYLPAGVCALGCAVLSVLYSHPATAFKGRPVLGPAVNGLGYGVLSALGGWVLAGVRMNLRTAVTFTLLTLWILGVVFAAQAFQRDDDVRRGYRTLVVTHGPEASIKAGRACMSGAVLAVLGLSAGGLYPRALLLAAPVFFGADRYLARWQREPDGGGPRWAEGAVQRMLLGGLVLLALAYADFFVANRGEGPVAGLGTAAGRPSDVTE